MPSGVMQEKDVQPTLKLVLELQQFHNYLKWQVVEPYNITTPNK